MGVPTIQQLPAKARLARTCVLVRDRRLVPCFVDDIDGCPKHLLPGILPPTGRKTLLHYYLDRRSIFCHRLILFLERSCKIQEIKFEVQCFVEYSACSDIAFTAGSMNCLAVSLPQTAFALGHPRVRGKLRPLKERSPFTPVPVSHSISASGDSASNSHPRWLLLLTPALVTRPVILIPNACSLHQISIRGTAPCNIHPIPYLLQAEFLK